METKKITMQAVKVLRRTPQENCIISDENLDFDALALFNSSVYKTIFKKPKKDTTQSKQRLSVVKITTGERTIYRQYAGRGVITNEKMIGLSPNAWQQLCLDNADNEVTVTKSWWFPFYWYHSYSATRVSFRMGIIAIAISIAGIIISIVIS